MANYNDTCRTGVLGCLKGAYAILRIVNVLAVISVFIGTASGQDGCNYFEQSDYMYQTPQARPWRAVFSKASPNMEALFAMAHTPQDVCNIVERYVRYRCDQGDEWQAPEETLRRRAGDCEDFAILVQHVCDQIGYHATVYVFFSR